MKEIDLAYRTMFAELDQRTFDAAFTSEFSPDGIFVKQKAKNLEFWYFQTEVDGKPFRKYVGPCSDEEINSRVAKFNELKNDLKSRRKLVSTLVRNAYLPSPERFTGDVVEALSNVGLFRLRAVLVGTVAYQCYSAVLGRRLDAVAMQTGNADFAEFHEISVAIKDSIPPILEVLRRVDSTFREVPSQSNGRISTQFVSREKFKVEFLTPNQWPGDQDGKPVRMPALGGAAALPLRFLDYLIYQPVRAVLLHNAGIPVLIPSPERYAIHKLIVGSRRKEDRDATAKSAKDRLQAKSIIEAMVANRQHSDLAAAFAEAWDRGDHWRAAIRNSIVTYDDSFQTSLQADLSKGLTQLGSDPASYELAAKPAKKGSTRPGAK